MTAPAYPPFNPFVRHPTSPLGKVRMVLCGAVLVPVRLTGALLTLSLCVLWCGLCKFGADADAPYPPARRRWLRAGCAALSRVLLFFYGFVRLRVTREVEEDAAAAGEEAAPPPLCVVNHIGFAETLYLVYSDGCSFVSKDANRALPFIGNIVSAMQGIFVDRAKGAPAPGEAAPRSTTDKILERARAPPGTWPPLAICPEGTTTTGRVLIRFATSAFRAGLPVQPVVVSSPFDPRWGYDPSFSCANIVTHILCLMTQPANQLHVHRLAVYVPSVAEKQDPVLYAANVRQKMAAALGVECYDLSWPDKLPFEASAAARELGRQKLAARNGGVAPPPPVFTEDAFGGALRADAAEGGSAKKNE